jgi:hypothetical protein
MGCLKFFPKSMSEMMNNFYFSTFSKIESLAKMLANGSEFVDWKHWLLFASVPWPYPTQTQLLHQLSTYKTLDNFNAGLISREEFFEV